VARKTEYKVVSKFDKNHDYKINIPNRHAIILQRLEVGDIFEPRALVDDVIANPPPNIVVKKSNINRIVTSLIAMGVKVGLLDRLTDGLEQEFVEFSALESVQFWMSRLSNPKQKHVEAIRLKGESGVQYTYRRRLFWFNKWVINKKIKLTYWKPDKISEDGEPLCKRTTENIIIQGVEHLLNLFLESEPKDNIHFQKLFFMYLSDPIHKGKLASSMTNDTVAIQSYFKKNYAKLKIDFDADKKYKKNIGGIEHKKELTLKDLQKILTDGHPTVMEKCIIMCKFQRGLDNSSFADSFNFEAFGLLSDYFGSEDYRNWDLNKCPIPMELIRMKTQYNHVGCIDRDALYCVIKWLNEREGITGQPLHRDEPMCITKQLSPVMDTYVGRVLPKLASKAKMLKKLSGYEVSVRYDKPTHELRDLLDSVLDKKGVKLYVVDEAIGHKTKNTYRKASQLFVNDFRREYMKASKDLNVLTGITNYLNGDDEKEELLDRIEIMESDSKEVNAKLKQKESKQEAIEDAIARQEDIQKRQQQDYVDMKKELEEIKKQQTNQKSFERPIEFCCAGCSIIHTKEQCPNCGSKIRRIYDSKITS